MLKIICRYHLDCAPPVFEYRWVNITNRMGQCLRKGWVSISESGGSIQSESATTGHAVDEASLKEKVLPELILDPNNKLSEIDVANIFLADDHVYNSYKGQETQMIWATELKGNSSGNWNTNHNRLLLVAGLISRAIEMVNSGQAVSMKSALWALQWKPDPALPGNVVHRLPELVAEGIFDRGLQLLKKQNPDLKIQSPNIAPRSIEIDSCKVFYRAI